MTEQFWTIEEWIPPENAIGGTGFWTELDDGHTHERLQAFRWYRKLKSDGRCVRMCEYTKRIEYDSSKQDEADE